MHLRVKCDDSEIVGEYSVVKFHNKIEKYKNCPIGIGAYLYLTQCEI